MRQIALILLLVLLFCPAHAQEPWCGLNTIYFQNTSSDDVSGYKTLRNYPISINETDLSVSVSAATGQLLIAQFITSANTPHVYSFSPGLRRYRVYHYVDKTQGVTTFTYKPYLYFKDGTQKPLYEVTTGEVDATEPDEYLISYAIPETVPLNLTDRIGIDVYAQTDSAAAIQAHVVFEGISNYSHIDAGYYSCEAPPTSTPIPNLPAPSTVPPEIPLYLWILLGIVAYLVLRVIL